MNRREFWIAISLILLGIALRAGMLARDVRFHSDEALYATFARRISLHGDILLRDAPLDKPPLGLILTSLSFSILGPTEFAARLPTALVSILTLAIFYRLARCLYVAQRIALAALLFLALSPMDLAFAATGFLDPLMTLFLLLAGLAASRSRWGLAGWWAIFAIGTKQNAVQFLPIFLGLGVARTAGKNFKWRHVWLQAKKFAFPVASGSLALALWSAARSAPVDFWTLGNYNNVGGLRFIRADEVFRRLEHWLDLSGNITGLTPLLALSLVPAFSSLRRRRIAREFILDTATALGILITLLMYWLLAFNIYDRYLHPLAPLVLLLAARGIHLLGALSVPMKTLIQTGAVLGSDRRVTRTNITGFVAATALVALCMVPHSLAALRGELVIGGDLGAHTGIDQLAAAISALPNGAIVYDHWLGWTLGFYLGDSPPIQIIWQPTPQALARAVCARSEAPQYFAAPAEEAVYWLAALEQGGVAAEPQYNGPLALYGLRCGA